jgi:hypothetical protein
VLSGILGALPACTPLESNVFFYELREGDDDIFADVLLAREDEMTADSFFALVQEIRLRIQDSYEEDTLIEAIADELEKDHEFVAISDQRITASVNVSKVDDENFLADLEEEDDEEMEGDYRGIYLELPNDPRRPN